MHTFAGLLLRQVDGQHCTFARIDRFALAPEAQKLALRKMMALKARAEDSWWREGHPGWESYPYGDETSFLVAQTVPDGVFRATQAQDVAASSKRDVSPSASCPPSGGSGQLSWQWERYSYLCSVYLIIC